MTLKLREPVSEIQFLQHDPDSTTTLPLYGARLVKVVGDKLVDVCTAVTDTPIGWLMQKVKDEYTDLPTYARFRSDMGSSDAFKGDPVGVAAGSGAIYGIHGFQGGFHRYSGNFSNQLSEKGNPFYTSNLPGGLTHFCPQRRDDCRCHSIGRNCDRDNQLDRCWHHLFQYRDVSVWGDHGTGSDFHYDFMHHHGNGRTDHGGLYYRGYPCRSSHDGFRIFSPCRTYVCLLFWRPFHDHATGGSGSLCCG